MKSKRFFLIFSLFMVLLCCFSAVSASEDVDDSVMLSDDGAVDEVVSEIDSCDEAISVENDEQLESVDDSCNESVADQEKEQVADDVLAAEENDNSVSGQTLNNDFSDSQISSDSDNTCQLDDENIYTVYVGQNDDSEGDGSYDNPFSSLQLACNNISGKDKAVINIFDGTYYLDSELKFNVNDLTLNSTGDNVIFTSNPKTKVSLTMSSTTANFAVNNITFDLTSVDQLIYAKNVNSYFKLFDTANLGVYTGCTFIANMYTSLYGSSEYNSKFLNCVFKDFQEIFYESLEGNTFTYFENCIFLMDESGDICDIAPVVYYTYDITFNGMWFGSNTIPSYMSQQANKDKGYVRDYKYPLTRYAQFSVSQNYLGNDLYEILGKLTWNGTDNQDGMENFQPMTVKLSSTTGDIEENATLINGNFRAVYSSSNPNHKVTAVLDNEELDLEFATVNITAASPSITYGQDQNVTITFTQAINSNVTISVNNKIYIVKVNDSDSFTFTIPDVLKQGTYTVNVTLSDESNKLYGSNSTELTVSKVTEYLFDAPQPAENPKVGDKVIIPVELPQDATGNVTVYVGETPFVKNAAQNVDVEIDGLVAGENKITVVYSGNDKYETKTLEFNITAEKINTEGNSTTSGNSTNTSSNSTTSADTQKQSSTSSAKKAKATKITAKKKTFKAKKKVKKYTITLKAGKKAVKKVWVTLKIKGKKIIKAKTNAKGKATFKIKKLTKKGKYSAVIKFKGNKNYKASSKKVKIVIK